MKFFRQTFLILSLLILCGGNLFAAAREDLTTRFDAPDLDDFVSFGGKA